MFYFVLLLWNPCTCSSPLRSTFPSHQAFLSESALSSYSDLGTYCGLSSTVECRGLTPGHAYRGIFYTGPYQESRRGK